MASSAWLLNPARGNELVAVSSGEPQSHCHPAEKENLLDTMALSLPLRCNFVLSLSFRSVIKFDLNSSHCL